MIRKTDFEQEPRESYRKSIPSFCISDTVTEGGIKPFRILLTTRSAVFLASSFVLNPLLPATQGITG